MTLGAASATWRGSLRRMLGACGVVTRRRSSAPQELILCWLGIDEPDKMCCSTCALNKHALECMEAYRTALRSRALIVSEANEGLFAPDGNREEVILEAPCELEQLD